ncbi:MAG: hypothetical protein OEY22_12040 [Candidatus Bathyarchaeota archaeon]|nr:hypothetical protein [Candidatus Bathyarchaeota archaeon]MDH5788919.1 hypothetical protein [Candidatus Bathyarchaeota archaeon]
MEACRRLAPGERAEREQKNRGSREEIIGVTSTQWGIITAAGSAISIVSKILLVGKLLDRFGRRRILLATTDQTYSPILFFIRCGMFV